MKLNLLKSWLIILILFVTSSVFAQNNPLAPTPPMGWMSWNFFADRINEKDLKEMAEAMVSSGMVKAGYNYVFIDDGWQGGRDNKNQIIPDPQKFPSGIKALSAFMHQRGMKLGIYSDAAPLTCAGYTASLNFEEQDAKTFASWDIDYLKYDYCGAPEDVETAKTRYKKMADALRKSGRDIVLGICEWGPRKPWLWASQAGGQLWRSTYDVRDKWQKRKNEVNGEGIMDILDVNSTLSAYAGPGKWNDPDMLLAGLYGKKGPSGDLGGTGCSNIEYQSQFSLWAMMSAPLYASNDIRSMNEETQRILLNEEVIALNQDQLGKQAELKTKNEDINVFLKPLSNGDYAIAVLNRGNEAKNLTVVFNELGLSENYEIRDLWSHRSIGKSKNWKGQVLSHETKVFRLSKV